MLRFGLLCTLAASCSYSSQYVAPRDGRPRAVWQEDRIVVEPAGAQLSADCLAELHGLAPYDQLESAEPLPLPQAAARRHFHLHTAFWLPLTVGAVVIAPLPLGPPPLIAPLAPPLPLPSARSDDSALVVLATLSLLALPAVDLALAIAPAEAAGKSARAVDQVNALNDLMRSPESSCRYSLAVAR